MVRSLGADEVIDYQASDFASVAGDLDVVLDSLGGDIARRSISVLRPGGLLVTIVGRRPHHRQDRADYLARSAPSASIAEHAVAELWPGIAAGT